MARADSFEDVGPEAGEPPSAAENDASPAWCEALRARCSELLEGLTTLAAEVDERVRAVELKERRWLGLVGKVERNLAASESKVDLNVGGRPFAASRSALLRWQGSYFQALLGSGCWRPEGGAGGAYFIDRDPDLFARVLGALRSGGPVDASGLSEVQVKGLRAELDYYQLPEVLLPSQAQWEALTWDPSRCSASLTVSEDGRAVTKTGGGTGWSAVAAVSPVACGSGAVPRFRVRVRSWGSNGFIMVGYARAGSFSPCQPNYNRSGWFIDCFNGRLYSGFGDTGRAYRAPISEGDVLEVHFDKPTGQIAFTVNGESPGVAFEAVMEDADGPLVPCVEILDPGAALALEC